MILKISFNSSRLNPVLNPSPRRTSLSIGTLMQVGYVKVCATFDQNWPINVSAIGDCRFGHSKLARLNRDSNPSPRRTKLSFGTLKQIDFVKVCAKFDDNRSRNTPAIGDLRFRALKTGFKPPTSTYGIFFYRTCLPQQYDDLCQFSYNSVEKHACYSPLKFLSQRSL